MYDSIMGNGGYTDTNAYITAKGTATNGRSTILLKRFMPLPITSKCRTTGQLCALLSQAGDKGGKSYEQEVI